MSDYRDDRYDSYEYNRRKDDFYREQDRHYENFRDDLEWRRQQSEKRSELAKTALGQGNVPWALHWMGGTDQATDLLRKQRSSHVSATTFARPNLRNLMDTAIRSFRKKSFKTAQEQFSQIIKQWPNIGTAYAYRAACRYELKKYRESISDLDQALRILPARAVLHLDRGRAYDRLGQFAKAETDYNRAIAVDAGLITAHYRRGLLRMRSRRYDDAITDFSRVIRAKPSYLSYAYLERGRCRYYVNQLSAASEDFSKALELDSNNFEAWMGRARCYWAKKLWSKAVEDCGRAIQLDPTDADVYRLRGDCRASLKDYRRALQDFAKSVDLAPGSDLTFYARGRLYLNLGKFPEARADIAKCIRLNTGWGTPLLLLGDTYRKEKDYMNALTNYHKAERIFKAQGNGKMRRLAREACENIFSVRPK